MNRSFMVLMSLVKSPIVRVLFCGTPQRGLLSPIRRYVRLLVSALTGRARGCSCVPPKRRDGTAISREKEQRRTAPDTIRISRRRTYVRRMTAGPTRTEAVVVKGLHNATFLPYGSSHMKRLRRIFIDRCDRPSLCCRPAGRKNASAADHARAWLQGTDRLETARNRREPPHHRLCDHDAGPHPQGCRYRRDPDCADGDTARSHRALGVVRGRRILHA